MTIIWKWASYPACQPALESSILACNQNYYLGCSTNQWAFHWVFLIFAIINVPRISKKLSLFSPPQNIRKIFCSTAKLWPLNVSFQASFAQATVIKCGALNRHRCRHLQCFCFTKIVGSCSVSNFLNKMAFFLGFLFNGKSNAKKNLEVFCDFWNVSRLKYHLQFSQ